MDDHDHDHDHDGVSGHWRLDLSQKYHRDVLTNISMVHAEEASFNKKQSGRRDTSQKGSVMPFFMN